MVQRLQSTVDSRFGLLQHLVEQSTDNVNQMNATVSALQQKINTQNESSGGKLDSVSGQVQSVNDSLDELKSRIGKLDKQLQDIQSQLQNVQSQPAASAPPSGGGLTQGQPLPGSGGDAPMASAPPQAAQAPPLQDTYQSALRDYNSAHYDVASSEFGDVLHYYPNDNLAGNAQFYIGEIAYKQQKYKDAIKAYNAVLEDFGGSPKAPAAQLHKGLAFIQLNQKDSGVRELRSLIQRYPQTPEALQARSKLNAMGVRLAPRPN
jgi:tol-pal system protein YbgF